MGCYGCFAPDRHPPNHNSVLILITTVLLTHHTLRNILFSALRTILRTDPNINPPKLYYFGLF